MRTFSLHRNAPVAFILVVKHVFSEAFNVRKHVASFPAGSALKLLASAAFP